jgi:hypothetical protein
VLAGPAAPRAVPEAGRRTGQAHRVADPGEKVGAADRLDQDCADSRVVGGLLVEVDFRAEHDHGMVRDAAVCMNGVGQRQPVRAGHPEVQDAEFVGLPAQRGPAQQRQCRLGILAQGRLGPPRTKLLVENEPVGDIVINDQNAQPGQDVERDRMIGLRGRSEGNHTPERAAVAGQAQLRVEHQIQPWRPLEQPPEIQPGRHSRARGPAVLPDRRHTL